LETSGINLHAAGGTLQQNGRYQAPEKLPVCDNYRNRQNLGFISASGVQLTYPDGIGNHLVEFDSWASPYIGIEKNLL